MQTIHAGHRYLFPEMVWGARLADILSETESGDLILDVRRFHDIEPTPAAPGFPYSHG